MPYSLFFDVTEKDFPEKVLEASRQRPVLVDFWAEWCPPCRALTPVLEKVTRGCHGEVLLARVEVDDNSARSEERHMDVPFAEPRMQIGRASARP